MPPPDTPLRFSGHTGPEQASPPRSSQRTTSRRRILDIPAFEFSIEGLTIGALLLTPSLLLVAFTPSTPIPEPRIPAVFVAAWGQSVLVGVATVVLAIGHLPVSVSIANALSHPTSTSPRSPR